MLTKECYEMLGFSRKLDCKSLNSNRQSYTGSMNNLPLLSKQDEEFQMLLEVAKEYTRQKREKTVQKKSGDATEIVIRNHLLKEGFNVTLRPNVKIQGSNVRNDSLLLLPNVDASKSIYTPNEMDMIIEIKNNAIVSRRNKQRTEPSALIREKFDELEKTTKVSRFAVVILSENSNYNYRITEEKVGKKNCHVFTLILRNRWDSLYETEVVNKMLKNGELWKTGEWGKFLAYLKG